MKRYEECSLFRLNIRDIVQHYCNDVLACAGIKGGFSAPLNFSSLYHGEWSYRGISQWSKRIGPNVSEYNGSSTSMIVRRQKRGLRGLEVTSLTIQWRGGFYLFRVGTLVPWPPLLNPSFQPSTPSSSLSLPSRRPAPLDNSVPGWLPTRPTLFNDFLVHWTQ